jgi:hypothetical protein
MSGRFLLLLLLLAMLATAATYFYTTETHKTLSEAGLSDVERRATLHGWPWGYYAEVMELTRVSENRVAVFEYGDLRWRKLGQTYLAWFVVSLVIVSVLVAVTAPPQRRR